MNPTSKKFISLFLIFSLVMLSANLYAKERRGAKLIITKKNGYQTDGELITVKPNSLLLLSITGRDVSVDIAEIEVIRVVKKSRIVEGALGGLLGGAVFGAVLAVMIALMIKAAVDGEGGVPLWFIWQGARPAGAVGAIAGGVVGAFVGIDKEIQIEGMTDLEIQKTLDKLRKKARIRDFK